MEEGNIGFAGWRKEQADRKRRLRKWPLGTTVFVKTTEGYEQGRIVHHLFRSACAHGAVVEFYRPVDIGNGQAPAKSHNIPYRRMKPMRPVVLSEKLFKRLEHLTDTNFHGIAYLAAARALGLKHQVAHLERINAEHRALGHLPWELAEERRMVYSHLFDYGILKLSKAQYKRLYDCF